MKLIGEIVEISIDDLVIIDVLKQANPQRTLSELQSLEEQIRSEGKVKDPFLIWSYNNQNCIVDGFGRFDIVTNLHNNEDFSPIVRAQYAEFESLVEARYWIGINQDARRNLTEEQKSYYYGQLYSELQNPANLSSYLKAKGRTEVKRPDISELVADVHRISKRTVFNSFDFFNGIELIKKGNSVFGHSLLNRELVDKSGDAIVVPMKKVRQLSKLSFRKAIASIEDIDSVISTSIEKKKEAAEKPQASPSKDMSITPLDGLKKEDVTLQDQVVQYEQSPTKDGFDRLVARLERLLKDQVKRKAA